MSGTRLAAGAFNKEVDIQRKIILKSKVGASIKNTLSMCPPSSSLLFKDKGSRIKDALDAARVESKSSSGGYHRFQPYKQPYKGRHSKKPYSAP